MAQGGVTGLSSVGSAGAAIQSARQPTTWMSGRGQNPPKYLPGDNVRFAHSTPKCRKAAFVKSFGRREAYESPRGTNPRDPGSCLWGFGFRVGLEGVVTARWKGLA